MKCSIFVVFFYCFFSFKSFSFNKDSLRICIIDEGSQYFMYTPSFGYIKNNDEYAGYGIRQQIDYEYFFKNKHSIMAGLTYDYFYLKHTNEVNEMALNIVYRKYFKLRKNYHFNVFTGLVFNRVILDVFQDNALDYDKSGITSSTGIGFHWLPIRKKKTRISKFGFHTSIFLVNFYSSVVSPYFSFGLKYRIK